MREYETFLRSRRVCLNTVSFYNRISPLSVHTQI